MYLKLSLISLSLILLFACHTTHKYRENNIRQITVCQSSSKYNNITIKQWSAKRKEILKNMQQVMGPLPSFYHLPDFNIRITDSIVEKNYTRYTILLTVAKNEELPALLYIPSVKEKLPAMIALHGTSNLGKNSIAGYSPKPNRSYAKELAERGYIVIAPDYPGFGDLKDYSFKNDRYVSGTMKGIYNHIRCIDFLQSLSMVDEDKIGVIGHSLGGHNAIFLAAFDDRIKIAVTSCGWTPFAYYDAGQKATELYGGKLGPWSQDLYMPFIKSIYNLNPAKIPFDFDDVLATIAPRVLYNNSPVRDANFDVNGVKYGFCNVEKIYKLFSAESNLYKQYPDDVHNFPQKIRKDAYSVIDSVFAFQSISDTLFF